MPMAVKLSHAMSINGIEPRGHCLGLNLVMSRCVVAKKGKN